MNGQYLQVYRLDDDNGQVAVAAAVLFAPKHIKDKPDWLPGQPEQGVDLAQLAFGEQATLKDGHWRFRFQDFDKLGYPIWNFENLDLFPHPAEFAQVKRIRYGVATDTLYLGGCTAEHKNQHWKPMGAVVYRYDNFLKGSEPGKTNGKLRWKIVLPYVAGSKGHKSCEPMGFDIAGDYLFAPYTGASKEAGIKTGHDEG
jgi:hypothetical protein